VKAIVTIRMPEEGCRSCPFKVEKLVIDRCAITNSKIDDFVYRRTRADNCPLREIPDDAPVLSVEDTPLEVLDLPMKVYNCLRRGGIDTVKQLKKALEHEDVFMRLRGIGRGRLEIIKMHLEEYEHGR